MHNANKEHLLGFLSCLNNKSWEKIKVIV